MKSAPIKNGEVDTFKLEGIKAYSGIYNKYIKRILDFILAIFFLIILLPVYLIVALLIVIETGFPIIYKAERGGLNGKSFHIYKFRTMIKEADKIGGGTTALNDPRITKIGNFLRKTKLDEITQLFNIVKGEMSFIGPRPELVKYTSQYYGDEELILKVRPGITDYSSIEFINLDEIVGGENADEIYEKFVLKKKNRLRIKYAATVSIKTDVYLFFYTAYKVIKKAINHIANK
ncbi:sugar transferase [Bhargavaea massiliensis]|uniref:sugar transferase n=1 Tax=Bhargavaea massiliensis TaxID=2697500 RepID=UPI001BCBF4CB|nr:sugar transferase [Bhargavaea massiliensis]